MVAVETWPRQDAAVRHNMHINRTSLDLLNMVFSYQTLAVLSSTFSATATLLSRQNEHCKETSLSWPKFKALQKLKWYSTVPENCQGLLLSSTAAENDVDS